MRGMSQARIDNKGHAPCYQFLNSSFILQYRMIKKIALNFGVSSDYILELEDIRPHFIFLNKALPIDKVAHIQFLIKDMEELYAKLEND